MKLKNMILKYQLMILYSYFKILGLGMKNSAGLGSLLIFYEWSNCCNLERIHRHLCVPEGWVIP